MASSSTINTLSLKPQPELLHHPKTLRNPMHNTLKPSNNNPLFHTQKPLHLYSTLRSTSELHISPEPLPNLHKPTSNSSPLRKFSTLCTEKIVFFLVGSFLFMGFLSTRPVVALPAQQSSSSEKMEEKRETQNEKSDDEEIFVEHQSSSREKMEENRETQNEESDDEEIYVELLKKNPRNVEALKVVFHEKVRRGKTKEAVEYVQRLIDAQPDEVEWRLLEALCYEMMGQLSKAKRLFKQILARRPLLLRALHGLAMVMHKKHEGPAVFEMLNKALQVARREKRVTEERNIKILIAQMHVVKGELEEGLEKFQILVDENPRDFRPYLCQGIIYSLLDKKKEAEEQFEIYRSLVPDEFPQRGFLDDVVLEAKASSRR